MESNYQVSLDMLNKKIVFNLMFDMNVFFLLCYNYILKAHV